MLTTRLPSEGIQPHWKHAPIASINELSNWMCAGVHHHQWRSMNSRRGPDIHYPRSLMTFAVHKVRLAQARISQRVTELQTNKCQVSCSEPEPSPAETNTGKLVQVDSPSPKQVKSCRVLMRTLNSHTDWWLMKVLARPSQNIGFGLWASHFLHQFSGVNFPVYYYYYTTPV